MGFRPEEFNIVKKEIKEQKITEFWSCTHLSNIFSFPLHKFIGGKCIFLFPF